MGKMGEKKVICFWGGGGGGIVLSTRVFGYWRTRAITWRDRKTKLSTPR